MVTYFSCSTFWCVFVWNVFMTLKLFDVILTVWKTPQFQFPENTSTTIIWKTPLFQLFWKTHRFQLSEKHRDFNFLKFTMISVFWKTPRSPFFFDRSCGADMLMCFCLDCIYRVKSFWCDYNFLNNTTISIFWKHFHCNFLKNTAISTFWSLQWFQFFEEHCAFYFVWT